MHQWFATIIGIVGGTVALAEQIRKWYQEWHKSHRGKQFDVVILDPDSGNRILQQFSTSYFICKHRKTQIPNSLLDKSGIFCSLDINFPLV
ncbi:MAG: hypothetical protein V7K32_28630 [Nostoc sp.]|uniref:hypothetical protein n=1 Tax=Nostoc sp. TaxID=1180 RepID=UPI002FFC10C3